MIKLLSLSPNDKLWRDCLNIYLESFPIDERRETRELERVNGSSGYKFCAVIKDSDICGIIETWEFSEFIFLEHLAIIREMQNQGLGHLVTVQLLNSSVKPVLLEAEVPFDEISNRRIDFYLKTGLKILDVDYTQPPYYPGKKSVPMLLLSNKELPLKSIKEYIQTIRLIVYKMP